MGIFSWYGLTIRTEVVTIIQQKYEEITGVNYRTDTKRFTHRRCKKLSILRRCEKNNNIMSKIQMQIQLLWLLKKPDFCNNIV